MKINKKKFIYLISPNKIPNSFYSNLKLVLKTGKVSFFQLRLKSYSQNKKMIIGEKIKNICKKNKVKFIINDDPLLALKLDADGCHLGQKDMNISDARKLIGNKIIGITCHNSIKLAKVASSNKADYIAFGAFNVSKTKKVKYIASINLIKKARKLTKIPIATLLFVAPLIYKPFALLALVLLAGITFETGVGGLDTALSQRQEAFRKIESNIDELEAKIASLRSYLSLLNKRNCTD